MFTLKMSNYLQELDGFLNSPSNRMTLSANLIRRLSPDSHSVMEFKTELDIHIAEKMLRFPLLGEKIDGGWNLVLANEFHMTNDSGLFKSESGKGRLPLYEGKMIHQFDAGFDKPRYWVDQTEAEADLHASRARNLRQQFKRLGIESDAALDQLLRTDEIPLDHYRYRFGFRDIAASTNERSMICAILPPTVCAGNTLNLLQPYLFEVTAEGWQSNLSLSNGEQLYVVGVLNSFTVDWLLRQKITSHLNMFYVYQTPLPRLTDADSAFRPIATRAARLICTTPEFDELAQAVGLSPHPNPLPQGEGARYGVTDPAERARLRAELDGLIAHLYGLSEAEFSHILSTFPLVAEPVKLAALNAYRAVENGLIR